MPIEPIIIRTLHDGLNVKDDPADPALSEGVTAECLGFDLTVGGKLQVAGGNSADHDLSDYLPSGTIQCSQVVYMLGSRYVLATTGSGLYANAALIDGSFKGRFKALVFGGNIYLCNGSLARRYDGTTCTRWGIAPPVVGPTITPGDNIYCVIDDMEDTTDWIANAADCVVADEGTIVKADDHSCKITMAAAGTGSTYREIEIDASVLDDDSESPDEDLVELWFYVDDLTAVSGLKIYFDLNDGSFESDFFSYAWTFYGYESQQILPSAGKSAEVVPEQSIELPVDIPGYTVTGGGGHWDSSGYTYGEFGYPEQTLNWVTDPVSVTPTTLTSKMSISRSNIEELFPELKTFLSTMLTLYKPTNLVELNSQTWIKLQVPKSYFQRTGSADYDWSNVVSVKLEVTATDAVNVYIDQIQVAGGGNLNGDYYFMYGWARADSEGNIQHYSGPARAADGTLHIQGPITFTRQMVDYATRVASTDPQVNACVFYIIGGNLTSWRVLYVLLDNDTDSGSFIAGEDDCYRNMISLRNDPAPAGRDMIFHKNAIWMVGFDNYPNMVRKSDISIEGDILLEAFPGRNAYIPTGAGGPLTSINVLNRQIVVRGQDGEWVMDISDPVDYSSVIQDEVVGKGSLSMDGVMNLGEAVIYPAAGAFVQSNGSSRTLILPQAAPVITAAGMAKAVAAFNNYEGYFSFLDQNLVQRTAKLDLLSGILRVCYQNGLKYDWLFVDSETGIVYGVTDGRVVRIDYGYTNAGAELDCALTTKVFSVPGQVVTWKRVVFDHLTNGQWLHAEVYIDRTLVAHNLFKSDTKTRHYFDFGPVSGNEFQLRLWGQYKALAEIYLPIKVY